MEVIEILTVTITEAFTTLKSVLSTQKCYLIKSRIKPRYKKWLGLLMRTWENSPSSFLSCVVLASSQIYRSTPLHPFLYSLSCWIKWTFHQELVYVYFDTAVRSRNSKNFWSFIFLITDNSDWELKIFFLNQVCYSLADLSN